MSIAMILKLFPVWATPQQVPGRSPAHLAANDHPSKSYFVQPFGAGGGSRRRTRIRVSHFGSRTTYVVECSYCHRRFTRTRPRTRLNRHKDQWGNHCLGRSGYLVDERHW
jgi:hypothetical protein